MLEKLKIMLCFEDSTQDEKLMLILDSVESRLRLLLGGADPPDEMEHIIIEVAIIRFNRIGSEVIMLKEKHSHMRPQMILLRLWMRFGHI